MREVEVTTTYLEMAGPDGIRPKRPPRPDIAVIQARIPCPELNRFLYTAVGGPWFWIDRLGWTYRQWLEWVDRPALHTWVAYVAGTPAGYFELEEQPLADGFQVELAYFGLLPRFAGQGLGGYLLTVALEKAWTLKPRRVWVHTCSLDHPAALANYLARGLRPYKETRHRQRLPDTPPGPWPGAGVPDAPVTDVPDAPVTPGPD